MTKFEQMLLRFLGVFIVIYLNKNQNSIAPEVHAMSEKFLETMATELGQVTIKDSL